MDKRPRISCSIITPESKVAQIMAINIILPAHDGLMGVLPDHAPMLCNLGTGLVQLRQTEDSQKTFHIDGGFAQIHDNNVMILTKKAVATDTK